MLPSLPQAAGGDEPRRRTQKGLPWRVLEKLLGLELKMRQYETGRRFCDAVVAEGGPELLARAWRGPDCPAQRERSSNSRRLWTARIGALAA